MQYVLPRFHGVYRLQVCQVSSTFLVRVAFKLVLNVWVAFKLEFAACVAF